MTGARTAATISRIVLLVSLAFGISVGVFALSGYSVADVFRGTLTGAITGTGALHASARWSMPLIVTACGVLVCFRAGFFNIGAQGQFYSGAIVALTVLITGNGITPWLLIPAAVLGGTLAGALWSVFPGFLRVRFGTDEVISTLMLNSIALLLVSYVADGPLRDPVGSGAAAVTADVPDAYRLSDSLGYSGALVGITLTVVASTALVMRLTRFGFLLELVGRNSLMAQWQGVRIGRVALLSFAWSGAAAGLAGTLELMGPSARIATGFQANIGFTAILVATIAGSSVAALVAAGLFFGGLQAASLYLPISAHLPPSGLGLLNGLVTLLITIAVLPLAVRRFGSRAIRSAVASPSPLVAER